MLLDDLISRLATLPEAERRKVEEEADKITSGMVWLPSPGPQTAAYFSQADDLFYGGQAGGGKSDLLLGLAINEHNNSLILRREREQVVDLFERCGEVLDTIEGRNSQQLRYDLDEKAIRFGGCKEESDKQKYKGRARDLYGFDEIGDFLKSQFVFIKTWNRSTKPGQRCRVVATGNPPTTAEGLWVIEYWAAWLDPKHPNPAKDGELRWYATDKTGKDREVEGRGPHKIAHEDGTTEEIYARSRTFIRAKLEDNPYLADTDYKATLDALPPELRSAYRDGRFDLALEDDPWQVIKTDWIMQAQARWTPRPPDGVPMCSIGVDIAQGGKDSTTLAPRHDSWFAPLIEVEGKKTPMPRDVVALIVRERRDSALPVLDMGGGYGGGVAEGLETNGIEYAKYKGASSSSARSQCKTFEFANKRTEAYWRFREALDPGQPGGSQIMLPDDARLVSDLTAPKYTVKRGGSGTMVIAITDKETLVKNLGRSPDRGDAVVMAWAFGVKIANMPEGKWPNKKTNRPKVQMGRDNQRRK